MASITIPANIRVTGRFKAVVHTGHKFDEFGNIVEFGEILRETPFGRNTITYTGFSKILQNQGTSLVMVAGAGNTTPAITDTTLVSYLGKSATLATQATTRNTTPDINDEVWWRTTYRITFAPGSLGGGSVNVAEAGISTNVSLGSVTSSTPLVARGLLVDGGGSPTTVSVNNAVEYLDIIWEYTEWLKASATGTVSLTIDGTPTMFDYEVRPYYFDNTSGGFNYGGWKDATGLTIPGYSPLRSTGGYGLSYSIQAFPGPLVAITGNTLSPTNSAYVPTNVSSDAYVSNSCERTLKCTWLPSEANISGGIGVVRMNLGHTNWQISFDAKIAKINTKQLDLFWKFTMANR